MRQHYSAHNNATNYTRVFIESNNNHCILYNIQNYASIENWKKIYNKTYKSKRLHYSAKFFASILVNYTRRKWILP